MVEGDSIDDVGGDWGIDLLGRGRKPGMARMLVTALKQQIHCGSASLLDEFVVQEHCL